MNRFLRALAVAAVAASVSADPKDTVALAPGSAAPPMADDSGGKNAAPRVGAPDKRDNAATRSAVGPSPTLGASSTHPAGVPRRTPDPPPPATK
jgi:hypothetical protein